MDGSWSKVQARADQQGGRLHWSQLSRHLQRGVIESWMRRGILTRVRPKVYALGYVRTDRLALTWEAILYAGPGAYLTGASGAHEIALINYPPRAVKVATPWQRRSLPGIIVLQRRPGTRREFHRGVPVAPLPELMLELAAEGNANLVRKALANLDYRRQLNLADLLAVCAKGRRGSTLLRRALHTHLPQLAHTNGPLEEALVILLDARHLPLPRCNVKLHGILVDAYWPELNLVVELDGDGNHGTAAQRRRDARDMAILQGHGLTVLRFTHEDVHLRTEATLARLASVGVRRAQSRA